MKLICVLPTTPTMGITGAPLWTFFLGCCSSYTKPLARATQTTTLRAVVSLDCLIPYTMLDSHWLTAFHFPLPNSELPLCGRIWELQLLQQLDSEFQRENLDRW